MGGEEAVEGEVRVAVEERGRGVGGREVRKSCVQGRGGGIGRVGQGSAYVTGICTEVENRGKFALNVLRD